LADKPKPKYEIIKRYIIQSITDKVFLPNHSIPSEKELCKTFRVSNIVVRRAIDELVHKDILYRIQGSGTYVALNPNLEKVTYNRKKIAVVLPYLNSSLTEGILSSVEKTLNKNGYLTVAAQTFEEQVLEENKLYSLYEEGFQGFIIFTSTVPEEQKNIARYINLKLPMIFVDRYVEEWPFDAVIGEDYKSGYEAAKHFYENHRLRNIGYFGAEAYPISCVRDRLNGVIDYVKEGGLPFEKNRFCSLFEFESKGKKKNIKNDVSKAAIKYLQTNESAEAIVATNDMFATDLYQACEKLNIKIPEEVAIISFSNEDYTEFLNPPLTSFDQNAKLTGETAALLLLKRINKEIGSIKIVEKIPYKLIIRESCGCKKNKKSD
jgi:GntR family transcriptional regulator of arabinose operon